MPKTTIREKEVRFKVNEDKYELIKKHADRHDESVSAFCRHVVMEKVNQLEALSAQSAGMQMLQFMQSLEETERKKLSE